jgi:hypothetical protein
VLRDGPTAFQKSASSARDAGAVIDKQVVERAKEFDKQWTAATVKFKAGMIDALVDLSQAFTEFWKDILPGGSWLNDKLEYWFGGLKGMTVPELKEAIAKSIEQGVDKVEIARLQAELDRRLSKTPLRITVTPTIDGGSPDNSAGPTVIPREHERNPFERAVFDTNKRIAAIDAETKATNEGTAARERAKLAAELEEAAKQANTRAGFQNATITDEQRKKIDALANAYAKATQRAAEVKAAGDLYFQSLQLGRTGIEQTVATQLRQIYGEDYLSHIDSAIAAQVRFNETLRETKTFGENALSGFLKDLRDGKSATEALQNVLHKLEDKLFDIASNKILSAAMGAFTGGNPFSGSNSSIAPSIAGPTGFAIGGAHEGAIVGQEATFARHFVSAPRFHTGGMIGIDEVPIIAKRGEGVFTEGQMRKMAPVDKVGGTGPVTVNVINAPAGTTATSTSKPDGAGGLRIDVMLSRMMDDGVASHVASGQSATNNAIERRYGLVPKL